MKKWLQTIIEVITGLDFLCLLGLDSFENTFAGYATIVGMLALLGINFWLLKTYGDYNA